MSSDTNSTLCKDENNNLVLPETCNVGTTDCFKCCENVCGPDNRTKCIEACIGIPTSTNGTVVYHNNCSSNYTDSTVQEACCQISCEKACSIDNNTNECIETCSQKCIDASRNSGYNFIDNILTGFPEVGITDYNTCYDCTNPQTLEMFGGSKEDCCKNSNCPSGCATGCMYDGDTCVEDAAQVAEIPQISSNWCENNPNCKDKNNKKWLKTFYDNLIQELQTPDDEGLVPNIDMSTCYVNTLAKIYPDPSAIPEQFPDIVLSQLDECIVNPEVDPGSPQLYFEEVAPVVTTEEESTDSAISLMFTELINFVKNNLVIVCLVILAGILLYKKNMNKTKTTRNNSSNYQTSLSATVNKMN